MNTFSVKNFEKFQHYKDRAPPWIKFYNETLDDYSFGSLPDASKFHLVAIWLLASRSENKIPYDAAWVGKRINADTPVDLAILVQAGFLLLDQPLQTVGHVASAPQAECLSREREETEGETEEKASSRSVVPTRPREPSRFDDFWKAYPRRDGPSPRKPAETKFNALVKSGIDPQMMIDAAAKLNASESAKGNIGTRFIPQAMTWLNQQRWADHAAVAFMASEIDPEAQLEIAVKFFGRTGVWSKHAGPDPSSTGCRASAELMAKYGMMIDGRKLEPPEAA